LLTALAAEKDSFQKSAAYLYDCLLFMEAYLKTTVVYEMTRRSQERLEQYIQSHQGIKNSLYNSGMAQTELCAAFSFEMVKWIRKKFPCCN
jgi:hypothetical protein